MATHKSAEKRARQAVKRSTRNTGAKAAVKTFEKKLRKAIEAKDPKMAITALKDFSKSIDKAAQKGILHVKTASRKISRLSKQVSSLVTK